MENSIMLPFWPITQLIDSATVETGAAAPLEQPICGLILETTTDITNMEVHLRDGRASTGSTHISIEG